MIATIAIESIGVCLDPQVIWQGTTNRCHPGASRSVANAIPPPPGWLYSHTKSHWQTPATFIDFLRNIIVPDRIATIARLGLRDDQKALVKMDLHYSHSDPSVLSFMKENHLLPLYVPACCTDVIQECDTTVANRPFKVAMKDAYRDYIHHIYTEWVAANPNYRDLIFYPKLTMGVMKPQLPDFIAAGLRHLGRPPLPRLSRRRSLKTDILLPCAAKSVIWLLQLH